MKHPKTLTSTLGLTFLVLLLVSTTADAGQVQLPAQVPGNIPVRVADNGAGFNLTLPIGAIVASPQDLQPITVFQIYDKDPTNADAAKVEIAAERLPDDMTYNQWREIQARIGLSYEAKIVETKPTTVNGRPALLKIIEVPSIGTIWETEIEINQVVYRISILHSLVSDKFYKLVLDGIQFTNSNRMQPNNIPSATRAPSLPAAPSSVAGFPDLKFPFNGQKTITCAYNADDPVCHPSSKIALDFGLNYETVRAAHNGILTRVYDSCGGNQIIIQDSSDSTYTTHYLHLSSYRGSTGAVTQGDEIATSGSTGSCTTGPHLHFQLSKSGVGQVKPEPMCGQTGFRRWQSVASCWAVPPTDEYIVDDGDAGFSASGGWTPVTSGWTRGCTGQGGDARWTLSRNPNYSNDADWSRWTPNLPRAGRYEVWAYWPGIENRTQDTQHALYKIHHAGGEAVVERSQRNAWCQWVSLGTFTFNAGTSGDVYLGDYTGGENPQTSVVADVVKFRFVDSLPLSRTLVDDGDDGFSGSAGWAIATDSWSRGCAGNSGDARWTYSRRIGYSNDVDWVKWTANLTQTGSYKVSIFVPGISNGIIDTEHARYLVHHADGETRIERSQRNNWCRWIDLGVFKFNTGADAWVYLGDYTGDSQQTGLVADAVKFEFIDTKDIVAPSGQVVFPANGTSINGPTTVNFTAEANDNPGGSGIDRVEFYVNYDGKWNPVCVDNTEPYACLWQVPAGLRQQQLIFTIHVIDKAGNRAMDPGGYHYVQYSPPARPPFAQKAREEIGMMYDTNRGKSRPSGPYGPWHYEKGVCTDVVIDTYVAAGVANWTWSEFWRSAPVMKKYFQENELYLSVDAPWKEGDIIFVGGPTWTSHVGIVTEVDAQGRPTRFVHAYKWGKPTEEFNMWWSWTTGQVIGHGRLKSLGTLSQVPRTAAVSSRELSIVLDTPAQTAVQLRLYSEEGKFVDREFDTSYPASNNFDFDPYIPNSSYNNTSTSQEIRVSDPTTGTFRIELFGNATVSYTLHVQEFWNGQVITETAQEYLGTIQAGESLILPIMLSGSGLHISPKSVASGPDLLPALGVPNLVEITGTTGSIDLRETTGITAALGVTLESTDLTARLVDQVPGNIVQFSVVSLTVPAGEQRTVRFNIAADKVMAGEVYEGSILVRSSNSGARRIPVRMHVPSVQVYSIDLPLVMRNYAPPVPLRADFVAAPTSGVAPLSAAFTNSSTGSYTDSLWDFGDGVTSPLLSPTHVYEMTGTYPVTLTVSNAGETNTLVRPNYIIVFDAPPCAEKILNGGFESDGDWDISLTAYPAIYTSTVVHGGSRALRAGIADPADNVESYSSARQTVPIPSTAQSAMLRFWLYPVMTGSPASDGDVQRVRLLDQLGNTKQILFEQRRDDRAWTYHQFELRDYGGETLQVYFGVQNNGTGGVTSMYIDDVSLQVCPAQ